MSLVKPLLVLWDSPTFTTIVNRLIASLRLFLVTPLLLTRFTENEIALWYLFALVAFFNQAILQRSQITFSRMYAFAMGGATSLASSNQRASSSTGEVNWKLFERAFLTQGLIERWLALLCFLLALVIGISILGDYIVETDKPSQAWVAFIIFQLIAASQIYFNRYLSALKGMNYIALGNRWSCLFSLLSIAAGAITLYLGGGLLELTLVMQSFVLMAILRTYFLLKCVESGKVAKFRSVIWDREVFGWSFGPTWRGLLAHLGNTGAFQLSGIAFAKIGGVSEVAAYVFSLRMALTIQQFSSAPVFSVTPRLSRMIAEGRMQEMQGALFTRTLVVIGSLMLAFIIFGLFAPLALQFIGANAQLISYESWILLGAFLAFWQFNTIGITLAALGNNIIFYLNGIVALPISLLGISLLGDKLGVLAPVLMGFLPLFLCFAHGPISYLWGNSDYKQRFRFQIGTVLLFAVYLSLSRVGIAITQ